jgi:hypothetical protein
MDFQGRGRAGEWGQGFCYASHTRFVGAGIGRLDGLDVVLT